MKLLEKNLAMELTKREKEHAMEFVPNPVSLWDVGFM
jgi:hypothetical protein